MADQDVFLDLPLRGSGIDRAGHLRTDAGFLAAAFADPASRLLEVCTTTKVAIGDDGDLAWKALPTSMEGLIFLGLDTAGAALFSIDIGDETPSGEQFVQVRDVATTLSDLESSAALQAIALTSWHRRHGHCAVCGAPTVISEAGHVRHCEACGADHYPRMDPAVIMLVTDGERCVLGRRMGAPEGRWSTLAGYVEPGESLEAAVAREVFEESGLSVSEVHYRGSQPWPFPSSLMLAFEARAAYQPLVISDEHHEVRWFTREEVANGLADHTMTIPPPLSAGHFLIRHFLR